MIILVNYNNYREFNNLIGIGKSMLKDVWLFLNGLVV